jgi:hypothetical protein
MTPGPSSQGGSGSTSSLRLPLGLALLALALRGAYLIESAGNPFRQHLHLDPAFYDQWARAILAGRDLVAGAFVQAPLYPYFLAGVYAVAGAAPGAALWVQAALAAATVFCAARVAQRAWGRGGAIAAGLLLALYRPGIFYVGVLLVPVLATFLLALALLLTPRRPLWAGVCTGLAGLAHPLLLPGGLVAVAGGLWSAHAGSAGRALRRPLLLAVLGTVLGIAPATIRNLSVGGGLVPIAANGGLNLYIGNGPAAGGYFTPPPGLGRDEDLHGLREAGRRAGRALDPGQASRFWSALAAREMSARPGRALGLVLRKVYLFVHAYEAPQVESLDFEQRYSRLLRVPFLPGWPLVVALAAVAVYLRRRDRLVLALTASAGATALATALFFVTARFRFPVHLYLGLAAAGGLVELSRVPLARGRRWWRAMAVAAAAVLIVVPNWAGVDRARTFGNLHYQLGVIAEQEGRAPDARSEYDAALRADPRQGRAAINLGILTARGGDLDRARALLEQGVALEPRSARGFLALGQIRQVCGDPAGACSLYARAWEADSSFTKGLEAYATACYLTGDVARAATLAREVVRRLGERDPVSARCLFLLDRLEERRRHGWPLWTGPARAEGDLAFAVRDLAQAEARYRAAEGADARDLGALLELVRIAAARGDAVERAARAERFRAAGGPASAIDGPAAADRP